MKSENGNLKSELTEERKAYLRGMASSGVDDFKVTCQCSELQGHFLTGEECEYLLTRSVGKTLRKSIEVKARAAFRKETAGEEVDNYAACQIADGYSEKLSVVNYSTLRKAIYILPKYNVGAHVSTRIIAEIKKRFPWGLCK